jgi:hypothetical protein
VPNIEPIISIREDPPHGVHVGRCDGDKALGTALAQLEPYTFEDVSRVQPFTCILAGQTASLRPAPDGEGALLKAAGRSVRLAP